MFGSIPNPFSKEGVGSGETSSDWLHRRVFKDDRLRFAAAGAATYFMGPQAGQAVWTMPRDRKDAPEHVGNAYWGAEQAGNEKGPEERGRELGTVQRAFMDAAYPGTNPWERLGTGQGGSAGSVAIRGQKTQERISQRTLSNQRAIAEKQAIAAIGPAVIKEHPSLATNLLRAISPMFRGGTKVQGNEMSERRFQFEQNVKAIELSIARDGVDAQVFKSVTERMAQELNEDRFDFEKAVAYTENAFKNKEAARKYVETMVSAWSSMAGNPMRALMAFLSELPGGEEGVKSYFKELREGFDRIDTLKVPAPGTVTSAPGRRGYPQKFERMRGVRK